MFVVLSLPPRQEGMAADFITSQYDIILLLKALQSGVPPFRFRGAFSWSTHASFRPSRKSFSYTSTRGHGCRFHHLTIWYFL